MPIDENMPNIWRDYSKVTRKRLIASDVADALTKVFKCKGNLTEMVDPYGPDADELDVMVEALKAADHKVHFKPQPEESKESKIYSIWQDYESQNFQRMNCKKSTLGKDVRRGEDSTPKILELDYPKCGARLANLQTEASAEEIESFAKADFKTA